MQSIYMYNNTNNVVLKENKKNELNMQKKLIILKKQNKILNIGTIVYLKSNNKKTNVYQYSGEIEEINSSLMYILEKFKPFGFVRCHKSYIVNIEYLYKFNSKKCILKI